MVSIPGLSEAGTTQSVTATLATAPQAAADEWVGRLAPNFALPQLDGRVVKLSALRGKVVLLNFWATWCAPCRLEMPWLADLSRHYRGRGLEVIGVAMDDDDREGIARFVRDRHIDYPILLKDGAVASAYGGVRFLPQTFLIGRNRKALSRAYGLSTRDAFEASIKRAIGGLRSARTKVNPPG